MDTLRNFTHTHIDKDCTNLEGVHNNELFYNCTFKQLQGLTLKDCVLDRSKFTTNKISDALDFTLTLNCHSFRDVEYSPLLFDLLLCLMCTTTGNDEKREKLLDVVGRHRASSIMKILKEQE